MNAHPTRLLCLVILACGLTACRKESPAEALEKSVAALEKAAEPPAATDGATDPAAGALAPVQQVKEAVSELKAGKMEDAVTRLQLLRAQTTLSPEQRMAVQDSVAALMAEIYALAEKGDARAVAAVAQYERMQTAR